MYPAMSPNMDDCVLTSSEKVGRCSASALKHCIIKEYLRNGTLNHNSNLEELGGGGGSAARDLNQLSWDVFMNPDNNTGIGSEKGI